MFTLKFSKVSLTLFLIFLCLMPATLMRDLNPLNELNYLAIAQDALDRHSLFAFYMDGAPYADKPPLYLWFCMLNVAILGNQAGIMIALGSVVPFIITLYIVNKCYFEKESVGFQVKVIISLCALLFFLVLSLVGRMDMMFTMFIALSYAFILKRVQEFEEKGDSHLYERSLPLSIFAGIFTKGPYAIIFVMAALLILLALRKELKLYFKVLRPTHLGLIIVCVLLWIAAVLVDGGLDYAQNLFIKQSGERLSGSLGHPKPLYWYLTNFWYLAFPFALSLLSFIVFDLKTKAANLSLERASSLAMILAVIIIISIPSSKLEIYLLPAIPYVAIFIIQALKDYANDKVPLLLNRVCLSLSAVILALLFPAHFFLKHLHPLVSDPLLEGSLFIISLCALIALYLIYKSQCLKAMTSFGIGFLGFCLLAGLAMPNVNPYLGYGTVAKLASQAIDEGFSSKVCITGYKNGDNLFIYDPRFKVYDVDSINDPTCSDAQLIVGRKALRDNANLRERLLAQGGIAVGDGIFLKR